MARPILTSVLAFLNRLFELEVGIVRHSVAHIDGHSEALASKTLRSHPVEVVASVAVVYQPRFGLGIHGDGGSWRSAPRRETAALCSQNAHKTGRIQGRVRNRTSVKAGFVSILAAQGDRKSLP